MIRGWNETNWYTEVMYLGLSSEGFLMDPLTHLPLLLHVKLWDLPNRNEMIGGRLLILMILLRVMPLLDSLSRSFKVYYFSIYVATSISPPCLILWLPWWTTSWIFPPSYYHIQPYLCLCTPCFWEFVMGFQLELRYIIPSIGLSFGQRYLFYRCNHMGIPWCALPVWKTGGGPTLCSTSQCLLE